MPEWKETLNLTSVWNHTGCARPIVVKIVEWCEEKAKTKEYEFDSELEEIIADFKKLLAKAPKKMDTVWSQAWLGKFDTVWDRFYDWADAQRIWVRTV